MMSEPSVRAYITLINQRMKQTLDKHLLPYNITPQQARIIGFIGTEQERGQSISQKDIEEAFQLTGPSITSLLQGLERKAFISRRPDPGDERKKLVTVLPKGLQLLHEFEAVFQQLEQGLVRGLSAEQRQVLLEALDQVARNLE